MKNPVYYFSEIGSILFNGFMDPKEDDVHADIMAPANAVATQVKANSGKFPCRTLFAQLFLGPMVLAHHGSTAPEKIWERQNALMQEYFAALTELGKENGSGGSGTADCAVFRDRAQRLIDTLNTKPGSGSTGLFYEEMRPPESSGPPYAAKANNYQTASRYYDAWQSTQNEEALKRALQSVEELYTKELDWIFFGADGTLQAKIRAIRENCLPQSGGFLPKGTSSGGVLFRALLCAACGASKNKAGARQLLEDFLGFPNEEAETQETASPGTVNTFVELLGDPDFRSMMHETQQTIPLMESLMEAMKACLKEERKAVCTQLERTDDDEEEEKLIRQLKRLKELIRQLDPKETR